MKQEKIPRVLHYFWSGHKPLSYIQQICFDSWKKFASHFEWKRWDEHNFDMDSTAYTRYHFEKKGWVMLSDYLRFHALATEGGIYLDTDMQLVRPLDELLGHEAFVGFGKPPQHAYHVPWLETCCMGSKKSHPVFEGILDDIEEDFVKRRRVYMPNIRLERYLKVRGLARYRAQVVSDVRVFTHEAFCPFWPFRDLPPGKPYRSDHPSEEAYVRAAKPFLSEDSYAIHWFRSSWTKDVVFRAPRGSALVELIKALRASQFLLKIDRLISHFLFYQRLKGLIIERFGTKDMRPRLSASDQAKRHSRSLNTAGVDGVDKELRAKSSEA